MLLPILYSKIKDAKARGIVRSMVAESGYDSILALIDILTDELEEGKWKEDCLREWRITAEFVKMLDEFSSFIDSLPKESKRSKSPEFKVYDRMLFLGIPGINEATISYSVRPSNRSARISGRWLFTRGDVVYCDFEQYSNYRFFKQGRIRLDIARNMLDNIRDVNYRVCDFHKKEMERIHLNKLHIPFSSYDTLRLIKFIPGPNAKVK